MIELFKKASNFVSNYYKTENVEQLTYHNYYYTLKVLKRANKLFESEDLSALDASVINFALLFSNTGFLKNYKNPYYTSQVIVDEFFKSTTIELYLKNDVKECIKILETKKPKNKIQEIVLDIYFSDYGIKKYTKYNSLLRKEIAAMTGSKMSASQWLSHEIEAMMSHSFYSDYAKSQWQGRKQKNLSRLLRQQNSLKNTKSKEKMKAYYKAKYKSEDPDRSIQTLYRVALRNHIKLSDIADTKANILLSVNAIIISLVLANLLSKLDNPTNRYMILPTIVFVIFSIISMIMSIKATQPNITRGEFTEKDLKNKDVNLAFFGNFYKMEFERYQTAVSNLIKNKADVYYTLTKDLYFLGSVLDTKYRLLRNTYYVFMAGTIVSVIAFTIAFIYRNVATI